MTDLPIVLSPSNAPNYSKILVGPSTNLRLMFMVTAIHVRKPLSRKIQSTRSPPRPIVASDAVDRCREWDCGWLPVDRRCGIRTYPASLSRDACAVGVYQGPASPRQRPKILSNASTSRQISAGSRRSRNLRSCRAPARRGAG